MQTPVNTHTEAERGKTTTSIWTARHELSSDKYNVQKKDDFVCTFSKYAYALISVCAQHQEQKKGRDFSITFQVRGCITLLCLVHWGSCRERIKGRPQKHSFHTYWIPRWAARCDGRTAEVLFLSVFHRHCGAIASIFNTCIRHTFRQTNKKDVYEHKWLLIWTLTSD